MNDSPWYINALEKSTQMLFGCLPSPTPHGKALSDCKIVGHRGAHNGTNVIENTLDAFAALAEANVWGAEADLRWTEDLVPVISHDPDCQRLFKKNLVIANTSFSQLRAEVPDIPSLAETVALLKGRVHLMLEIKAEHFPSPSKQAAILKTVLSPLKPMKDYHFLALDKDLFSTVPFSPLESQILVGIFNVGEVSQQVLTNHYGGIAGAYPFFTRSLRERHRQAGQKIGTGHIDSKRLLFQEIAKGTDWIFSNRPLILQTIVKRFLE